MEAFAELVPEAILDRSGSVFYSGRAAFMRPSPLYIVGMNPGGDAELQRDNTIARHLSDALGRQTDQWSEYADGLWRGAKPGKWGMQPRILHLCRQLGLDVHSVPASNLVFVRSNREATLGLNKGSLIDLCWPFHAAVLQRLRPKLVACLGQTAGRAFRIRTGANELLETFVEQNDRKWSSTIHRAPDGLLIATLTHPGVAAWTAAATDPTPMVARYLQSP